MSKQSIQVRKLALAALFASMGIILKMTSITTAYFRLSLFDSILILAGIVLGPIYGLTIGIIVDVIEYIILLRGFPFSFMILLGTMLTGFIPGVIFLFHKQQEGKTPFIRIILSVIIATTVAYGINTLYFYRLMGMGFLNSLLPRTITLIIKWPLYSILIPILYHTYLRYSPLRNEPNKSNENQLNI